MSAQSKIGQILIEDLVIENWESKITKKVKKLSELLVKTNGQSPIPPLVKREGNDSYALLVDSEVAIAAKLAEMQQGLERLTVLIPEIDTWRMDSNDKDLTCELTEMANILVEPKTTKPVTPKKVTQPKSAPQQRIERLIEKAAAEKKASGTKTLCQEMAEAKPVVELNYRKLQKKLKTYREQGMTKIRLNSKKEILVEELRRIENEWN